MELELENYSVDDILRDIESKTHLGRAQRVEYYSTNLETIDSNMKTWLLSHFHYFTLISDAYRSLKTNLSLAKQNLKDFGPLLEQIQKEFINDISKQTDHQQQKNLLTVS